MLHTLVRLAGALQIALVLGSLTIPRVLAWSSELRQLKPLFRQLFWTYAGYIAGTNLAMGLLCALAPDSLLDGSTLARGVAGYATLYWGARLLLQFLCFDRTMRPPGAIFKLAEAALVGTFVSLTTLYGVVVFR